MSLTYISDHITRQKEKIISQLKDQPNFEALLTVLLEPLQDLETFINQLWNKVNVDAGQGDVLDLIGRIVDLSRGGYSDTEYRSLLRLKIGTNVSKGNFQPLVNIIKEVTDSTYVEMQEIFPAGVTAVIDGGNLSTELLSLLELTVSAGIDLNLSSITSFPPFAFEGITEAGGMGTIHDTNIGGHFIDRIEV